MLTDFADEFRRYRTLGERALGQLPDARLNRVSATDGNSPAMLVRHLSGNFLSRFTDFLESDGEKPWRERDEEFAEREYSRSEVEEMWTRGWSVVEAALESLSERHLTQTVTIREQPLSVHAALCRSVAHAAYHTGQLVLMARQEAEASWEWLSIPKGESRAYDAAPVHEKGPPQKSPAGGG